MGLRGEPHILGNKSRLLRRGDDNEAKPGMYACSVMSDSFETPWTVLLGSSVHGIFQARIPEWVDISYSRGSSHPRDENCVSCVSCISRWILYPYTTWGTPKPGVCVVKILLTFNRIFMGQVTSGN